MPSKRNARLAEDERLVKERFSDPVWRRAYFAALPGVAATASGVPADNIIVRTAEIADATWRFMVLCEELPE